MSPNTIRPYLHLMRFEKPIGFFLLLWPTLWGLWIAGQGHPNALLLIVFIIGTFLMRSAGCVINDLADRHIDGRIRRTRNRPLANKTLTANQALLFAGLLLGLAGILLFFLNTLSILLCVLGLGFAILYPFLKRFTHWPQAGLGIAFSWGIPVAFAAQTGHVPPFAWCLFVAAFFWPLAYDSQYALADYADDQEAQVKSTAILLGTKTPRLILGCQLLMILFLIEVGAHLPHPLWFYGGLLAAVLLMAYQYQLTANINPTKCFKAFHNNLWVGLSIFIGIVFSYLSFHFFTVWG